MSELPEAPVVPGPHMDITERTALTPIHAFTAVTDWRRHAALGTSVVVHDEGAGGSGTRFTATTQVGPWTFDDRMAVVEWHPPTPERGYGMCRIAKLGPALAGGAVLEVFGHTGGGRSVGSAPGTPTGVGSVVRWREWLSVGAGPVQAVSAQVGAWLSPWVFRPLLRSLVTS